MLPNVSKVATALIIIEIIAQKSCQREFLLVQDNTSIATITSMEGNHSKQYQKDLCDRYSQLSVSAI